jgi:hypothetical protein
MMIHDFSKMIATKTAHQGAVFGGCGDHGDHFAKYPPHPARSPAPQRRRVRRDLKDV